MKQEMENARPIVTAEVQQRLGWAADDYSLEARTFDRESGTLVIAVVHVDDVRKPIPGGGKSWRVDYDVRQGKVIRWLKYQ